MTTTPISRQDLRRRIDGKAKAEPSWRFWGLYVHVCKRETLREGWKRWSRQWLYQRLGLFNNDRVQRPRLKALPAREGSSP
jgi:hypothetical protein